MSAKAFRHKNCSKQSYGEKDTEYGTIFVFFYAIQDYICEREKEIQAFFFKSIGR